jgi:hypothetical protein
MLSRLSVYWSPEHKAQRPGDREYIANLQPYDVLILDPGVGDVLDAHKASPDSEIVLRYWGLDDNRTDQNPEGVYGWLRDDPVGLAKHQAQEYKHRTLDILSRAWQQGIDTLQLDQLVAHGVNEPDTNNLVAQINTYTVTACEEFSKIGMRFEALNFGTGHPVHLIGGDGTPVDWSLYEPALEAIEAGGHYAVTHEYYNDLGIEHESVRPWHIGRGNFMPRGCKRKIGEFGLEMLLNKRMDGHHGFQGVISNEQYLHDIDWYMANVVRDDVCSVRIF